jgi:hypothetical protein
MAKPYPYATTNVIVPVRAMPLRWVDSMSCRGYVIGVLEMLCRCAWPSAALLLGYDPMPSRPPSLAFGL